MHAADCRYDNALNKANVASLALQQPAEAQDDFADDADDDLQASLVRARRAAQLKAAASKPSVEDVAAEAARRREEQERAALETGNACSMMSFRLCLLQPESLQSCPPSRPNG